MQKEQLGPPLEIIAMCVLAASTVFGLLYFVAHREIPFKQGAIANLSPETFKVLGGLLFAVGLACAITTFFIRGRRTSIWLMLLLGAAGILSFART